MTGAPDGSRRLAPEPTRPPRMAPLAKLPLFFDLDNRLVLLAGSSDAVAWKAELFLAAGATLRVAAAQPRAELGAIVEMHPHRVVWLERVWREEDMDGAAFAVLATGRDDEAEAFAAAARRRNVPVNVIDRPDYCDFQFGAIVNRSPAIVAIGTDGAAPVLAQAIRRRIEALLPAALAGWAAYAKGFRDRVARMLPERNDRRRFWERFTEACFSRPAPFDDGPLAAMAAAVAADGGHGTGEVILVGAGPGDAGLMTFAGMRALQMADVIFYDRLVTDEVLELCRREARRVRVGKKGHGAFCRQEDISAEMIAEAKAGHIVVRLKGGDPAIFGRAGEELDAVRAHDIPVRIVPGITTASAAAAAAGISLTHRDHGRRLQFVSGHDRTGALPGDLDFDALADRAATTCVYMPIRTLPELARKLLARNLPASTPVLLAQAVGWADQSFETTSLGAAAIAKGLPDSDRPVLAIIGTVVAPHGEDALRDPPLAKAFSAEVATGAAENALTPPLKPTSPAGAAA